MTRTIRNTIDRKHQRRNQELHAYICWLVDTGRADWPTTNKIRDAYDKEHIGNPWIAACRLCGLTEHVNLPMLIVRTKHTDSGHGWIRVPMSDLLMLGIAGDITAFSYRRGIHVWLEEDQDADTYQKALAKRKIAMMTTNTHDGDQSPIRQYDPYWH